MFDTRLLWRVTVIGLAVQLLLSLTGHFVPWVAINLFAFGRMMISASAGYFYGMDFGRGYAVGALGGALGGGLCVIPAVALSVLLGDTAAPMLAVATGVCILTGAVGGAFGQMAAFMRRIRP